MDSKLLLLPTALMIAGNSAAEAKGRNQTSVLIFWLLWQMTLAILI